jgi:hypothetical protein
MMRAKTGVTKQALEMRGKERTRSAIFPYLYICKEWSRPAQCHPVAKSCPANSQNKAGL